MYDWNEQLTKGEKAEHVIDDWVIDNWEMRVEEVPMEFQRRGIDRIWTSPDDLIVSVDTFDIPGWTYTSIAQYLLYYIPPSNIFYMMPMTEIKRKVSAWLGGRKPIRFRNKDYCAYGVLFPLRRIRQECIYEKIEMVCT